MRSWGAILARRIRVANRRRQLLLYEVAAADARPLRGIACLAEFDVLMLAGRPTIEPRVVPVPVRMPYPPAKHQGSIYENQTAVRSRYFATASEPALAR